MPNEPPLRVFGDPARLRDQVRRLIKRGDELMAALDAAEHVYADRVKEKPDLLRQTKSTGRLASVFAKVDLAMSLDETQSIGAWSGAVRRRLQRGLGADGPRQMRDVRLPTPRSADHEPREFLSAQRQYVSARLEDLHGVLSRLPTAVPPLAPQAIEFTELRASGLVEEVQLNAYLKRMASVRTRQQMSAAIGASKELVESVLRAALESLDPAETPEHDFPRLAKQVRQRIEVRLREAGLHLTGGAERQFSTGLVSIEHALAELRNDVGEGHGRPRLPAALAARHARLAIDTAHAYTRYLVGCLVDLKLVRLEPPAEPALVDRRPGPRAEASG